MERREYLFAAAGDPGQVFAALAARYAVHADPSSASSWTYLDTADWRLHRVGMTLREARRGRSRELVLVTESQERIAAPSRVRSWPRRLDLLPPSPVHERIAAPVGVRALLPIAEVGVRSLPLRLLDDADKIRVRVRVDQQRLVGSGNRPLPMRVLVSPMRGYERDAERCATLLADRLPAFDGQDSAATIAMAATGRTPGQPAVARLVLQPQAPAIDSLASVLRRWMDVIDSTRSGVVDDVDPEYLHELRTAVRAMRSILSAYGELLPSAQVERFASEFAWLGHLTAPLRDIDVYQLELAGSVADLDDLEPLRRHLTGRRSRALKAVRAGLGSQRGQGLSGDWRQVLEAVGTAQLSGPSTIALARVHAIDAYRRVVKAAAPVTRQTPADELHRLRRRCKRMRYLLDSYESIYAPVPHRAVLSALRKLQDCLGEIQDSDVQRTQLVDIAENLAANGSPVAAVLAIGALRERTSARDADARRELDRRLQRFAAPGMRARVRALTDSTS